MSSRIVQSILLLAVGVGIGVCLSRSPSRPALERGAERNSPKPITNFAKKSVAAWYNPSASCEVVATKVLGNQKKDKAEIKRKKPNIVYFLVDNLGFGELGCYGGGILRGTKTARMDKFASQGLRLLNFAPESQCTPSRSALMTGRFAIRSGNHTVMLPGSTGGLVAWERTIASILSPFGYVTFIVGKWHIGNADGRWPTDHGFDAWYGIPHSYDECLWLDDPWYNPKRDPVSRTIEGKKGGKVKELEQLTLTVRRDIDVEYMKRAKSFMNKSVEKDQPFFLYFNHSMMHMPTVPRPEFKGKTGNGDFADCLLELDTDFGALLDTLDELGVADNTIVVFSGDNGPEELAPWRGTAGFFDGSYFSGSEGNLRTPCIIRYPGKVPAAKESNDVVHITDMFPTLVRWAGAEIPKDRVIDGKDQRAFFEGKDRESARDGFPYWMGKTLYGVKWHNFKLKFVDQKYSTDPARTLPSPQIFNLIADPKERNPFNPPHLHSWVSAHFARIMREFEESVEREPLIPAGARLDYVPKK